MKKLLHIILLAGVVCALSFGFSQAAYAAGNTPGKVTLVSVKTESAKSITVNWKKTSNAEGYHIYRKGKKGGFKKVASVDDPKATSFTDKKLKPGTIYTYTVKAYSGKKEGAFDKKGKRAKTAVTISPSSKPYRITEPYNYNAATRTYWAIQSYLDSFKGLDSSMLILKKGTYNIPGTIWIPSGANVVLSKGVKVNKTENSGGAYIGYAGRLFIFMDRSLSQKANAVKGYKGVQNASVTANGTAVINMPTANGIVFVAPHSKNILISGVTVSLTGKNQKAFQLLSSSNVQIEKCAVTGKKNKDDRGVLIDLAAAGVLQDYPFAKRDNAVCKNITISGCKFKNLRNAVVSPRFIKNKYHSGITIQKCKISKISEDAIRVYNWNGFSILNNTFDTIADGAVCKAGPSLAIRLNGGWAPVIKGNTFTNLPRAISATRNKNSVPALSGQGKPKNKISAKAWKIIEEQNQPGKLGDYYSSELVGSETVRHWFADSKRTYTITPTSKPYRNQNLLNSNYIKNKSKLEWRQYYAFLSYLEQIERNGGGTLIITKGEYQLPMRLLIPSNTTIKLLDGVTIKEHSSKAKINPGPIIELVNMADLDKGVKYKKYGGVHDVTIEGPQKGTAVIDKAYCIGTTVTIAHTKNVTIRNITFKNMTGRAHFIELDASFGTLIEGCVFSGCSPLDSKKGAINIDTPDKKTGGFKAQTDPKKTYTSFDCTADSNVTITGNTFTQLPLAVETHNYTPSHPHKKIIITDNTIETYYSGIRAQNWVEPVIKNNTIKISSSSWSDSSPDNWGIYLQGVDNPTVLENNVSFAKSPKEAHYYFMRITNVSSDVVGYQNIITTNLSREKLLYNWVTGRGTESSIRIDDATGVSWWDLIDPNGQFNPVIPNNQEGENP